MFCTGEKTQLPEPGTVTPMKAHVVWLQDFAGDSCGGVADDILL